MNDSSKPASRTFRLVLAASASIVVMTALVIGPAPRRVAAADDLASVLGRLDASAAKFKSAHADIVSDSVQTQPVPDKDTLGGSVLFARTNGQLQMAMHLKTDNGKPLEKDVVFSGGTLKVYEPRLKQLQIFKVGSNTATSDTVLTLGFGGSGKDLEKSWTVTYAGNEQVDGKAAAKLELVPRDPTVKNTFPKVVLWIDLDRGVAVRQQRFDPSGNYNLVNYSNIRLNDPVPAKAFELNPPSGTQVVNH